ncbi:alpha/beta fold hydrolase [Kitasatospora sp. MY 5-36]|uniref:alpha/beta fold hydrolase n=1 Tax=Kitasatospora sp. MY 5-36 TaxID=1678027 RepID=UPI000A5AFFEC|nr:alpha/beta fold hydrolase [Kitasatospora sp. MY 5-36]
MTITEIRTLPARHAVTTTDHTATTDDHARLAITVHQPGEPDPSRPLVVLVHGWAASRTVWHATASQLAAAGHTVATYDQRGHASSTAGREPIGIERLARDLDTVVGTLTTPERPVVVVGHSGGGYAALAWAAGLSATGPSAAKGGASVKRLAGLVLVSTASHGQNTPANEVKMMGSKLFSRALGTPWLGRRLLGGTHGPSATLAAREANRRLFAATVPKVRAACFASTQEMDQRAGLAGITAPTAVITGTEDKIVKPSFSQELASALPHAELHRIPGTGHMVPLEAPQHVAHHVHLLVTAGR